MRNAEARHFQIDRTIALPRAELWEVLANTDRLNQVLELPAVSFSAPKQDDTLLVREARGKLRNIIPLSWKEYPFHWVRNEEYAVLRIYNNGPLRRFWGGIRLTEIGPKTTLLSVFADLTAANSFGDLLIPVLAKTSMDKTIGYCVAAVEAYLNGKSPPLPYNRFNSKLNEEALTPLLGRLMQAPVNQRLVSRLATLLREGDDSEISGLRPKPLAWQWNVPLSDVLRLFLHATKLGILNLGWHQMCPHCRVSKAEYSSLSLLSGTFDCDLCGTTYETNFDRFVELRFAVHPYVRPASSGVYCIGGPFATPHIIAQTSIESGEKTTLNVGLNTKDLRLRVLKLNHTLPIGTGYASTGAVSYTSDGWAGEMVIPTPDGTIEVLNRSARPIVLAMEKEDWDTSALTAAQITAFKEFRELFSGEVLAPGQTVKIESLTLLFSDLCDSTQLYENLGDAPAYGSVRRHFAWLFDIIGNYNGAIVKTIGDSVMAVFQSPEDALQASIKIQKNVGELNTLALEDEQISIKIGMHHGPAIAINANDRLDYFGRTVNIAARLQNSGEGGDIIFAEDFANRPGVQSILQNENLLISTFYANLKGIDGVFFLHKVRLQPFMSVSYAALSS